jgi:hypothetical protein
MHPKPSELGSQAGVGLPSTAEGDHAGTSGVVSNIHSFILFFFSFYLSYYFASFASFY